MSKLIGRLLVVLAFGWAGSAGAMPVTVDGREWLQPVDFVNLTWNDISGVCDSSTGNCNADALGAQPNMQSWTWASVEDTNSLFNFIIGQTLLGPGPDQDLYLPLYTVYPLFTAAGFASTLNLSYHEALIGWARSTTNRGTALRPQAGSNLFWCCDYVTSLFDLDRDDQYSWLGGWFYRDLDEEPPTEAPVPATLPLMGLSLIALGYSRRRRMKHA